MKAIGAGASIILLPGQHVGFQGSKSFKGKVGEWTYKATASTSNGPSVSFTGSFTVVE